MIDRLKLASGYKVQNKAQKRASETLRKGAVLCLLGSVLLSGCGLKSSESSTEVTVGDNQALVYGVVTSIQGNQITYMEVEESVVEAQLGTSDTETKSKENSTEQTSTEAGSIGSSEGSMGTPPDMSSDGSTGTPPDMSSEGSMGTPPDMSSDGSMGTPPDMSGDMAAGETGEVSTESTPQDNTSASGSTSGNTGRGGKMNAMTGESVTTQIPVGVVVHTATDTETTFSRIASGDILKILTETDADGNAVIIEIWMMQ